MTFASWGWGMTLSMSSWFFSTIAIEHPCVFCTDLLCYEIQLSIEIINGIIRRWKFLSLWYISIEILFN